MLPKSMPPAPLAECKCGCGLTLKLLTSKGRIVEYKPGHHKVKDGRPAYSKRKWCAACNKTFSHNSNRKYCSRKCYWKIRGATYDPLKSYVAGRASKDRAEFRVVSSPRIQRLYILEQYDGCQRCGWNEYKQVLQMHHVNENKKDGRLENLRLLCPTCHDVEHFLGKSGKYDPNRQERARKMKERFGISTLPRGVLAKTALQEIMDREKKLKRKSKGGY